MPELDGNTKIFVAGHRGLVGSAIVRALEARGARAILTKSRNELDLRDQAATRAFFERERPHYVFCAAAKVGGILANNTYPADFIYDNIMIEANVIDAAYRSGVRKLIFLGSTCVYPKFAPQPIKEDHLLTGPLEPTNEAYAIAKIAGLKMCEAYRKQFGFAAMTLMPTNLYGPGDYFDLERSHVIPALLRKALEAKQSNAPNMVVWGTGTAMREFLYVDDMADACIFCMENVDGYSMANAGSSEEISIASLARLIMDMVGYGGGIVFDASKPDGTPRKLSDTSRLTGLGWQAKTSLRDGLRKTCEWYLSSSAARH